MLKRDELALPDSCLNKARDDELVFVLLERDQAAPAAIRAWIARRIELGKERPGDPKLESALAMVRRMEQAHERPASTDAAVDRIARSGPEPGSVWRHKTSARVYRVVSCAIEPTTNDAAVILHDEYPQGKTFDRTLPVWWSWPLEDFEKGCFAMTAPAAKATT